MADPSRFAVVRRPPPSNVPSSLIGRVGGVLGLDLLQDGRRSLVVDDRAGPHRLARGLVRKKVEVVNRGRADRHLKRE